MRVWLVNHYAVTPDQGGGTRHYDIASELARRGYDVTVWATSRSHGSGKNYFAHDDWKPRVQQVDNIRWVWLRTSFYHGNGIRRGLNMVSFFFSFLMAALVFTRGKIEKPDLIVGSSVHPLTPFATTLLAKWWRLPVITEIRDIWPIALREAPMSRFHPAYLLFEAIELFVYRFSNAVVTLLPNSIEHIVSLGARPEKVYWVPNGTALEMVERSGSNDPAQALYLGSLSTQYGLEILLEAASLLQQRGSSVQMVLQGSGPDRARLESIAQDLALKNLTFRNHVPKHEVPDILGNADILIYSTPRVELHRYGLSANKLFDYLASGRPVLFACGAPNNPVEAANAGVSVPPAEPDAIADGLEKLAAMAEKERLLMGKRGQAFIAEHHTITQISNKFERAITDTMHSVGRQDRLPRPVQ